MWADRGRRTLKYHQLLTEVLELDDAERALVTVLLLRGAAGAGGCEPAPSGCTASPTGRPSRWSSPAWPRAPSRWYASCRASAGITTPDGCTCSARCRPTSAAAAAPAVDRDVVLEAGAEARDARVRASYDAVAPAYADHLVDELLGSSRSSAGCSTASPATRTAALWSRSAAVRAT